MLGKLSIESIPHDPIVLTTLIGAILGGLGVVALITKFKLWGYLWKEWFTSVDHKKIGVMYLIVAFVMLLRGFS
ncbi:cytochrome o ubiquinol oxidase subunit I, partial [Stenotrophomonas sp. NPDC078853]